MERVVIAHSSLGDSLLFKSMKGCEILSEWYEYTIDLLSKDNSINLNNMLGKTLALELKPRPDVTRYLSGIIARMEFVGHEKHIEEYYVYRVTLVPELWYLTQNKGFRIWQNKNVQEIVTSVLDEYGISYESALTASYRQWDYCVQYQETMYNFIQRMMQHEGIYFYFKHSVDKQTLVLADAPGAHKPFPGYDNIEYHQDGSGGYVNCESIDTWLSSASITPSLHQQDDYNYLESNADLSSTLKVSDSGALKTATQREWPGQYQTQGDGTNYIKIRQQEHVARQRESKGAGDAFGLAPGYTFKLSMAPRDSDNDQEFLITRVDYELIENSYASNDDDKTLHRFNFVVVPAKVQWRPARTAPWPRSAGPQTAVVVNAPDATKGDKTYVATDQYGRVRVKFLWYKPADEQELYSCWIRVSSGWAGTQLGNYQIPRVGEEVIVDFINGDPHMPVIVGRVYNNLQTQPVAKSKVTLAKESDPGKEDSITSVADSDWSWSKSGYWTRTVGSSDTTNGNHITFEDRAGEESLDIHAEKYLNISAKNGIRIYSAKQDDGAIDIWAPGSINIYSGNSINQTAKNLNEHHEGKRWGMYGASFTFTGIQFAINGVNGAMNLVSNLAYSTTDFAIKGVSMDYTYLKRSKTQVEWKSDIGRYEQVPFYNLRAGLYTVMNGGAVADEPTTEADQTSNSFANKLRKLREENKMRKQIKKNTDQKKKEDTDGKSNLTGEDTSERGKIKNESTRQKRNENRRQNDENSDNYDGINDLFGE